jgi:hypothetical protein
MDFQFFTSTGSKPIILTPNTAELTGSIPVPKSAKSAYVLAIGPGGSGGNGFSRAAGSAGGGGGGGGSGVISRALIPASIFNGSLFYKLQLGGLTPLLGSCAVFALKTASTLGAALVWAESGVTGGNGTATALGAGGSGGLLSELRYPGFGVRVVGANGGNGGAQTGAAGVAINPAFAAIVTSGAGGGGCTTTDFAGGAVTYTTNFSITSAGGLAGGGKGNDGWVISGVSAGFGGTGGGSNNAGVGGAGGAGAPGCGGGGGGAGVTGGAGGRGGDGQIMIWWL